MNHEELSGVVERFLFQSPETGFSVFVLQINSSESTIVKGTFPQLNAGEHVQLKGAWVMHPKFGKQFDASSCTAKVPTSIIGLKKYLGSGLIKGIGPVYAEKLVDHFGQSILEVIDKEPERLEEVSGIGKGRLEKIVTAWRDQREISNIMVFLQDKGVSAAYATKIYKAYGHQSIARLQENPYRMAEDIWGIGFKMADQVAQQLGFEKESVKRIKAGILFAIQQAVSKGHLYVELQALKEESFTLLEIDKEANAARMKQALHELYESDKIKLITHNNVHFVALTQHYYCEKGVAHKIKELKKYPTKHIFDTHAIYQQLRAPSAREIALNEEQQQGILAALQHKVTVITGGPGTGKTTLIKKLLSILDDHKLSYKLAAPTGRAAKRMMEGTGRYALTVHRLLEFDFTTRGFLHNEENALKLDFLILDEASMIDIFLAYSILKALPLNAHLVLIGDVDQLPSVGAGNFLNDTIESGEIASIRLQHIFRQAQDSMIIVNAHRINRGEFPTSSLEGAKRDYIFIKEDEGANVAQHLQNIYAKGLPKYGIKAHESIVLVPMNKGIVGTQQINHHLQNILNPENNQNMLTRMGTNYKVGDRVMQIRNNYDKNVFNGDVGTIEEINLEDKILLVRMGDDTVEYDFSELDELVLAYAISIHKSQGSEYSAVIVPIFMQHFTLLQRNLIYTAITRAKKLCIFIGQPRAIAMAIKNNKGLKRTTFLQEYLTTDLSCR